MTVKKTAAQIRSGLDHPVVDFDGHTYEFIPALLDVLKDVAGIGAVQDLKAVGFGVGVKSGEDWHALTPAERIARSVTKPSWWSFPTRSATDRATAQAPRLLYERLDELGLDFCVVYPSLGLVFPHIDDHDLRVAACRAVNRYHAELFAPYKDRLTPVAAIPLHSPQEGLDELRYAAGTLGYKAVFIPSYIKRPIAAARTQFPGSERWASRLDMLALDSEHDYDPFWAECVKLKIPLSTHSIGNGWGSRMSPSNFVYNHIGHFAAAMEASCKALILGGVPQRFPELRFAFLEGGVSWAMQLYFDLIGHWEKRNVHALRQNLDPSLLNADEYGRILLQYAPQQFREHILNGRLGLPDATRTFEPFDEFAAARITSGKDISLIFQRNFYFGCEADDPMTPLAFGKVDQRVFNAVLGSDIGHFDVPDVRGVIPEAVEPLEEGHISKVDFRNFVCDNAIRFFSEANPGFFCGTSVDTYLKQRTVS